MNFLLVSVFVCSLSAALSAEPLFQEKTAEEIFKKIEETIEKAKAVSVRFKYNLSEKSVDPGQEVESGTLLLKEDNKARLAMRIFFPHGGQEPQDVLVVSEGSKMMLKSGSRKPREIETPKTLNNGFRTILARASVLFFSIAFQKEEGERDFKKTFQVSDFKSGEDDKGAKTLTYKLKVKLTERPVSDVEWDVKLWYDPKNWKLLRRTLGVQSQDHPRRLAETYEDYILNADIPDEKFKFSEEDK